jgi:hypothetical protein
MSLTGDLRTMPLPDVLQWVASGRKSGTLYIELRSVQKRLILRGGNVYSSWSNDPRESLGQFLIRLRLVTEEQLFEALLRQEAEGRMLGAILIEQRLITEEQLREVLRLKAEETLYDLFLWPAGKFEFREGELPYGSLVSIETPVTPVILEGVRRVDEWDRIRTVFPTMDTTLRTVAPLPPDAPPDEQEFMNLAAAGLTLAQITAELRTSDFETATLAFDLYTRGHLRVDVVQDREQGPDTVGAIQALLALAQERLQEGRYDSARKTFQDVLALDRLNQHAKKGLLAAAEARDRERTVRKIPRDRVPELAVDFATLTRQNLDPHEGFVLSRVNGQWDVQSILKLCPMAEDETLLIFSRLLERKLIRLC